MVVGFWNAYNVPFVWGLWSHCSYSFIRSLSRALVFGFRILSNRGSILMKENMIDNYRTNFWRFSLLFSVSPSLRRVHSDKNRLPTITLSRFFQVLWDDDNCPQRNVKGVSRVFPPSACHRGRLPSIILRVLAIKAISDISLDHADGPVTMMSKVLHTMTQAVLMSPDFGAYEDISPPFGILLFYLFNFIVSVCTIRAANSY